VKTFTSKDFETGNAFARQVFSLVGLWIRLGWNIRKARRAFEMELIKQGMKKEDAQRVSAQLSKLKDEMMRNLGQFAYRRR
jgi:replication fork clamp-binding protein CrfC